MQRLKKNRKNWLATALFAGGIGVCVGAIFGVWSVFADAPTACATEYYVDSAFGDDLNDGTSPETPWRSLDKVDAAELAPGDVVRFRRGRIWRGTLRAKSGADGKPLVYSDFGDDGPKPRILRSADLSSPDAWTKIDDGIWATVPDEIVAKKRRPGEDVDPTLNRFAAGGWHVYTENDAKAKSAETVFSELDGKRGYTLTCEKSGSKGSYLQWTTQNFPVRAGKAVAWRFKAKSSVPFAFGNGVARLMKTSKPWTGYGAVLAAPEKIGADWTEYEIVFQTTADADDGRITLFLGGVLPDGARFEFVPGAAREVELKTLGLTADVGNLIFTKKALNGEDGDGSVPGVLPPRDKRSRMSGPFVAELEAATKTFPPTWSDREFAGFKRWSLDELNEPFDFWFDLETRRVFVRCDKNPGETFASVEAALRTNTGICNANDVIIENLAFTHTGSHGISLNNAVRCVIRDCDFDWIGGGDLYNEGGSGRRVRYGNGVEFWESSEDCVVERCRFSRVYDTATTTQGPGLTRSKNLTFRDCVMFDCEQAFEIWFTNPETTVEGLLFERNVCVDSGRGWSHRQRPDKRATPLLAYGLTAKTVDATVRNNVFCGTAQWFLWFRHSRIADYKIDGNVYWAADESVEPRENGDKFFWFDAKNPQSLTLDEFRAQTGQDENSRWLEPKFRDAAKNDFEILNRDELGDVGPRLGDAK